MSENKQHLFDNPRNVERLIGGLYVACALVLAVDLLDLFGWVHFKHGHFAAESFPGFYGIYGLVGCVLLVLSAKLLRRVVGRAEDYYEAVDEKAPAADGESS